jgi:hypothetical protein
MRKTSLVLAAVRTLTIALALASTHATRAQTTKTFEPRQLQEDFEIARKSIEESQGGLYRHTKKPDLDRIFGEAEKSIDHPMDFCGFYRLMTVADGSNPG